MKAYICDHCGKKIDCLPHSTALERCMNRHRIRMKAQQGGNENITLEDMPTRATIATITIFLPTHCSTTVPPNIEEIDLCPECRQIFNGWIAAFFHLGETDFDSVYIAPQGSPNCAEEQTTLDSGSIGENAADISGSL